MNSLQEKLVLLYGSERGSAAMRRLEDIIAAFRQQYPRPSDDELSERDAVLITYGDSLWEPDQPPLQTLHQFLKRTLRGVVSTVHILPFFPYSSDDGFSVIDYKQVDPQLGDWTDIQRLGQDFKLMVDGVVNHVSVRSEWFQRFLAGDPAYRDFFITVDPATDLSHVVRPRNLPLLTPVETKRGTEHVWTTFSTDQIDLNFANPDVLLTIVDVLLFYIRQGATLIRLDAIAYLWKVPGTSSIHLPQTHTVVQLLRDVLDQVAPQVSVITETNVPHAENLSYFGSGTNEAQLVYQFTLPPLMLHTFITGDATHLSTWAAGIKPISDRATFFNFTASHDGIGVRPVEGILSRAEIDQLIERTQQHGGAVSYKANSDGSRSPYELNINYFDALSNPAGNESLDLQARRFLASQAIQLAFVGMPGIYIHSLLGSRNWHAGVQQTGQLRSYRHLIQVRTNEPAFHPVAPQAVLNLHPALFTLRRTSRDGRSSVIAIHNVSNQVVQTELPAGRYLDLIGDTPVETTTLEIEPYQVLWLKEDV
jgi:sucrose phosphorylase